MGISKTEEFTAAQNEIATMMKALAHPARVAIVEFLISAEACICGDIVAHLPLAQPTVSQHLKELKSAGLIKGSIEGKAICYCVNEAAIDRLQSHFSNISRQMNKKKCC